MKRDKIYISGPVSSIGLDEAFAELGKAVAACGVNDKTIKSKSKKQKKE